MKDEVILVDKDDNQLGIMEKIEAHEKALLHRAFSVFIFNTKGEMLLQRRALHKYHSPGLWTNTCCSHPKPNESALDAANRRLIEEMNMEAKLDYLFKFTYKTEFDNGLTEHEIDHVFKGITDIQPIPNPEEVDSFKYISIKDLKNDIIDNPNNYTSWFKICLKEVLSYFELKETIQ